MMVLMRLPSPISPATLLGVDHVELQLLRDDLLLHLARQMIPDLVRPERSVQQEHRAGRAYSRTSRFSRNWNWWQATKFAERIRYGERIGRGPKRRWEMVMAPDFLRVVDEISLDMSQASPRR